MGISLVAVFVVAQLLGVRTATPDMWEIFEFQAAAESADFTIEQSPHAITARLTNTGDTEISTGADFITVFFSEETGDWRIFPFGGHVEFAAVEIVLPPGYSARFTLTEDMLIADFLPGRYRIVVNIRGEETQAWAEFELLERES